MNIEHITFNTGNSSVRSTDIIEDYTIEFFKNFQIPGGRYESQIQYTRLTCKIIVEENIAVFYLLDENAIIVSANICCFSANERELAIGYASFIAANLGYEVQQYPAISPQCDKFFITIMGLIPCDLSTVKTAGEIELYIYDAIRRGIQKTIKIRE